MAREHHIQVRRTARYTVLGPNDGGVRELWFVLHGYGQLAAQFLRVFEVLDDGTRLIVAPEALNRFYLAGVESAPAAERAVGATWMTREDRVSEIDDYVAYLDAVSVTVRSDFRGDATPPRIVVLGFSQGTATAARWVAQGALPPDDIVLWGGVLPPEIDLSAADSPVRRASLRIVIGSHDRFASSDRLADEERRMSNANVPYQLIRYEGGHGIAKHALVDLARDLSTARA
jgi:predicted esterase